MTEVTDTATPLQLLEAAYAELLTDEMRVFGPDHPNTLTTRNNLAAFRGRAEDAPSAAAAFEELLADYVRVLGPDHPDTLGARANLARWRGYAGDAAGAAAALRLRSALSEIR